MSAVAAILDPGRGHLRVREAIKKESDQAWLAFGTLGAAGRYRQANWALAVSEAKTWVWEEFGEVMENDFCLASQRFWQTVRQLR